MSPTRVSAGASPVQTVTERAGEWFLRSGIQEKNGGVARFYRIDLGANATVSTEITGYTVSALVYLHDRTGNPEYLEAALRAGEFLVRRAWDSELSVFPFEHVEDGQAPPEPLTYFFDTGIIARGLLALWRASGEREFLEGAIRAGESLHRDFASEPLFHPILELPSKAALPYTTQWSRGQGCYQLKSAMAWHDLAAATGDDHWTGYFERALAAAMESHRSFLPAATPDKTMDRLHAYSYFLEALLTESKRPQVRQALGEGIQRAAGYLRAIAPGFERSDVYAQILRVRVIADQLGAVDLNAHEAREEAVRIPTFQFEDEDTRVDGGYCFGRKAGRMLPYANPVSTAFCMQAVEMWSDYCAGATIERLSLI